MNEYLKPAKTRTWNPLIHSLRLVNKSFYALVIEKKMTSLCSLENIYSKVECKSVILVSEDDMHVVF